MFSLCILVSDHDWVLSSRAGFGIARPCREVVVMVWIPMVELTWDYVQVSYLPGYQLCMPFSPMPPIYSVTSTFIGQAAEHYYMKKNDGLSSSELKEDNAKKKKE